MLKENRTGPRLERHVGSRVGKSLVGGARSRGHGRNGVQDYAGARRIKVEHATLKHGQRCPECQKGKIYEVTAPGLIIRVVGQAPLAATVYEMEKLRCNLCGEVFTAERPAGVGQEKYDETAATMIALLKYGGGFPFHRLERLQQNLEIPLPASTQWEIVAETPDVLSPVYEELIRQGAQGEVLYNDDTTMKILEFGRDGPEEEDCQQDEEGEKWKRRKGVFTSGIVSTVRARKLPCFSPGTSTRGRTWLTCWRGGLPGSGLPSKCVML